MQCSHKRKQISSHYVGMLQPSWQRHELIATSHQFEP